AWGTQHGRCRRSRGGRAGVAVEPIDVPQDLELQDVIAWGLSALDLLCLTGGAVVAWWLYLALPDWMPARLGVALPAALAGAALGLLRVGDITARQWLVDAWASLLSSLAHPVQILIRTRQLETAGLAPFPESDDPAAAQLRSSYRRLLDELAGRRRVLDRRFLVIVPWDGASGRAAKETGGLDVLEQRLRWIEECLRRLDLQPR